MAGQTDSSTMAYTGAPIEVTGAYTQYGDVSQEGGDVIQEVLAGVSSFVENPAEGIQNLIQMAGDNPAATAATAFGLAVGGIKGGAIAGVGSVALSYLMDNVPALRELKESFPLRGLSDIEANADEYRMSAGIADELGAGVAAGLGAASSEAQQVTRDSMGSDVDAHDRDDVAFDGPVMSA